MTVRAMKAGRGRVPDQARARTRAPDGDRRGDRARRASHEARRETDALRERYERLTPREREVLPLVVAGLLNKQIAASSPPPSARSSSTAPTS
jgi:FixJ family two-component response regulator